MKNFLIQSKNNIPCHDFGYTLIESIKYNNWFYNEQKYQFCLAEYIYQYDFSKYIPIGSVEFVQSFLLVYHNVNNIKPINIPKELRQTKYLKRHIQYHYGQQVAIGSQTWFVKSEDKIKGFNEILKIGDNLPGGKFLMSDLIDIESEWRAFVFNGKLIGLQNYSGDFTMFPDVKLIQDMINDYNDCPPAFTLDVGINKKDGTFLIESHNFFSCGLYGFSDHRILPQMFIQSFNYLLKNGY